LQSLGGRAAPGGEGGAGAEVTAELFESEGRSGRGVEARPGGHEDGGGFAVATGEDAGGGEFAERGGELGGSEVAQFGGEGGAEGAEFDGVGGGGGAVEEIGDVRAVGERGSGRWSGGVVGVG